MLGSGDISIPTGITVGTTAVTSGTVGRIFFQGSGNVVQQDSNLFWDNTNKRLGVGATPSTSVRLDVRAQGSASTDIGLRVRNSADTQNLFQVQGNGVVSSTNGSNSSFEFGTTYKFHQSVQGFSTNGAAMFEIANISGNTLGSLRMQNTAGQILTYLYGELESSGINGKIDLRRNGSNRISITATNAGGYISGLNNLNVGFGTTLSTAASLDIKAAGALSTDIAFRVRNSADTANKL